MAEATPIRVDTTPNPNSLKFSVGRDMWGDRPLTVGDPLQAFTMPLAGRLLAVEGVRSVFFLRDFVTVTRRPEAEWEPLRRAVTAILEEHLAAE